MNPIENIDITPQQFEEVRSRLVEELEVAPTRTTEEFVSDTLASINDALVYINDVTPVLTSPGIHMSVDPATEVDAIEASLIYNHAQASIINPSAIVPPVSMLTTEDMESINSELESFLEDNEPVVSESEAIEVQDEVEALVESIAESVEEIAASIPVVPTVIPVNPIDTNSIITSRFSSALWFDKIKQADVILAGVGGIGSYVAFLLSRLDIHSLLMYDDDIVGAENLSGQLFSIANINYPKVDAMHQMLKTYSNFFKASTYTRKYTSSSSKAKVMICGFDNMSARKVFYNSWKSGMVNLNLEDRKKFLFIDGRLAAEEYQILCIQGDDEYSMNKYETEFLFTDEEADPTLCSYKQTTFMATQIASTMVNLFVNFIANQCEPIIDRDLPFYTEYNASTMFFKTIN